MATYDINRIICMEQYYQLLQSAMNKVVEDCEKNNFSLNHIKAWRNRWQQQADMLMDYYHSDAWQADMRAYKLRLLQTRQTYNVLEKEAIKELLESFDTIDVKCGHAHYVATLYGPIPTINEE